MTLFLSRLNHNNLLYGVFLGLLGFAGNWFKFELFFNVDFLFGSLFVMLAIVRFGTVAGVVAGIIAASCTFLLWHHPWAIFIMTAEALFVAWRLRRDDRDCLAEDIIFWLFLGAPLVWFFYFQILHVGSQSTLLIMLKQSINGVFNALLASIIHLALRIRSRTPNSYPSFQEILFITMVSIILIPSFVYLTLKVRDEIRGGQEQIREAAVHTSTSARSALDQWLRVHHQDVKLLATLVGSPSSSSPEKMQRFVELVKQASPDFVKMGVLDHKAVIVAYSPLVENGVTNIGVSFADRPYIPLLKATMQPYVLDMVTGKLGAKVPILPLLVPMAGKNGFDGYCVGISDLSRIKLLLSDLVTRQHENITILDRNGNVVVSTREDLKTMEHFQRSSGASIRQIRDGYFHWIPEIKKGSSIMSRWMSSLFVRETMVSNELPWKVVVEISPRPMLDKLSNSSINAFLMMASIIILSALFARFISKSYVRPLQLLQLETQHIPEVFDEQFSGFERHTSRIKELYGLNENFRQMTQILHDRMQEVRRANQARIASVETEKQHLYEKEMLVKDLHDGIGGLITKISMLAQYAKTNNTFEAYDEIMDKILALAYEGGVEIRSFMNSLESEQPAWGDLLAEMTEHCERMFEHNNIALSISSSIAPEAPGAGIFRYVNIVRIFREAVANIVKHANARTVRFELNITQDRFTLVLSDDGTGYEVTSVRKRGVANMYSRAAMLGADFSIESPPSGGTTITLSMSVGGSGVLRPCA
jgi:signal transduction histidine kinase